MLPRAPPDRPSLPEDYVMPEVWSADSSAAKHALGGMNAPSAAPRTRGELQRGRHALQLYSAGTPNGIKVTALLEELGVDYDAWPVDFLTGQQFTTGFTTLNPNQKIPALFDYGVVPPVRVFESGAILLYLAEKLGRFVPRVVPERTECLNWLFWAQANLGPACGNVFGHYFHYAPVRIQYAIDRATCELRRVFDVLNRHLADGRAFVVGSELTVADFAICPWLRAVPLGYTNSRRFAGLDDFVHVWPYVDRFFSRPAVKRGVRVNGFGRNAVRERHSPADFEPHSKL